MKGNTLRKKKKYFLLALFLILILVLAMSNEVKAETTEAEPISDEDFELKETQIIDTGQKGENVIKVFTTNRKGTEYYLEK